MFDALNRARAAAELAAGSPAGWGPPATDLFADSLGGLAQIFGAQALVIIERQSIRRSTWAVGPDRSRLRSHRWPNRAQHNLDLLYGINQD